MTRMLNTNKVLELRMFNSLTLKILNLWHRLIMLSRCIRRSFCLTIQIKPLTFQAAISQNT